MPLYAKAQPMEFLPISWDFRSEIEGNFSLVALLQTHSSADLSRFKVPLTAVSVAVDLDGNDWYDLHFVKAKIEGLLKFFELQWSEPKPQIGFRPQ